MVFLSTFYHDEFNQLTKLLAVTVDDLIDVIMKDHRKYIRW